MTERVFGLDLETTGLDLKNDRILKLGIVISDAGKFYSHYENEITLYNETYPQIHPQAYETHRIEINSVKEFGSDPRGVYNWLESFFDNHNIRYLIAHNGHGFDFPMLERNVDCFYPALNNRLEKCIKIDTMVDLPVKSKRLSYMAVDHGFMNPFPHSAISDVKTMLKIMDHYPFDKIVERAKSPMIKVMANVDFADNHLAKAKGFNWDSENKRWIKSMKKIDFENESFQFRVSATGG